MKNANGFGGIQKLSGKRRKPYMAYKNVKTGIGIETQSTSKLQKLKDCTDINKAFECYTEIISLFNVPDITVINMLYADAKKRAVASNLHYKKVAIGYYETKKDALIALSEHNADNIDISGKEITFRNIADKVCEKNVYYNKAMERLQAICDMPIADIRADDMQRCIDLLEGKSTALIQRPLRIIRDVYGYATKYDLVRKDYSALLEMPKVSEVKEKKPFTKEEIAILWEYEFDYTVRIVLVLIYSGLRIRELLSLKTSDVKDGYLEVNGTKTKAAKRIVPIHDKVAYIIEAQVKASNEYLFSYNKKKYSYQYFYVHFCKAMDRYSINHTIHETRHTFATYSLGMDDTLRKFIIGHATNSITNDVYTHQRELIPKLKAEISKYDV